MLSPLIIGISGLFLTDEERRIIRKWQPSGYVLFSRNIETVEQVRSLTDELFSLSTIPPLISIDQEGGRVVRTKALGVEMPSAQDLAQSGDSKDIGDHAYFTAELLHQLGINMNLAPVLDIGVRDARLNALSSRCWGDNVEQVISYAGVYLQAMSRYGMATCGKHYPGLGNAEVDAHYELPVISLTKEEMLRRDIIPFTAFDEKLLPAMMVAHIQMPEWDKEWPSSLSSVVIRDMLRNQLGYNGLVMTDDLDMHAITNHYDLAVAVCRALEAGNDLAMVCHSLPRLEEIAEAVHKLDAVLLSDARMRIERFAWKYAVHRHDFSKDRVYAIIEKTQKVYEKFLTRHEPSHLSSDEASSPVQKY